MSATDTAAELERVKHVIGSHFGIDMRSPEQVEEAEAAAAEAQEELEQQQTEEAEAAAEEAAAEEASTAPAPATKSSGRGLK